MLFLACQINAQEINGKWNGILDVQGMQLTIAFNIEEEDGTLLTSMDSPDQGVSGIPTDETIFVDGNLTITIAAMQIKYEGKFDEEKNSIEGTFNQGPMSIPLTLSKEKVVKEVKSKPQDPKDFPYNQEEVRFINKNGGHKIAGTLTTPTDGSFNKVLVLITGSGPQNRDEELLGHRPFLVLSDHLTRNGTAVLRCDDRGVAESEGDFQTATSEDFVTDISAAVDYLQSRADMKGKKIGLLGHSEGGMIAPMLAAKRKDIDLIVLLAGPGINIVELMMLQTSLMAKAEGAPDDIVDANSKILNAAFEYLKENPTKENEALTSGLRKIFDEGYDKFPESARAEMGTKEEFFDEHSKMILTDWFRFFIGFEPAEHLSKVSCPVLAVNGELDLQVTSKENLKGIEDALTNAGNENFTVKEFPGLNHLFQTATTGASSEYSAIEETFNVEVMEFVSDWLKQQ